MRSRQLVEAAMTRASIRQVLAEAVAAGPKCRVKSWFCLFGQFGREVKL